MNMGSPIFEIKAENILFLARGLSERMEKKYCIDKGVLFLSLRRQTLYCKCKISEGGQRERREDRLIDKLYHILRD